MELYKKALANQINALEDFKEHENPELMIELKKELGKVQRISS